jgi:hypothetical protein
MSKRTATTFPTEDSVPEAGRRQGVAEADQRSVDEKYRDLASDVVDLRHDAQRLRALVIARDLKTDELIRRVRELEALSVLDVFADLTVADPTEKLDRVRALIDGNDTAEFLGSQIRDALAEPRS